MLQAVKYIELLALMVGLLNWKKAQSSFFKSLVLVVAIVTLSEFAGAFVRKMNGTNLAFYNVFAIPVVFLAYFCAFLIDSWQRNRYFKAFSLLTILAVCTYIFGLLIIDFRKEFCSLGYCVASVVLAAFAFIKIKDIIVYEDIIDFFRLPLVYVLMMIFFYYILTIPFYGIIYFVDVKIATQTLVFKILKNVSSMLNIALYISYIILFVWMKNKY